MAKKKTTKKVKRKVGCPTKYKPEYCEKIIEFFDREPWTPKTQESLSRTGEKVSIITNVPCKLPTYERFAFEVGVHRDTLHEWCKNHPKFSDAYKKCKDLQKEILIQNGLFAFYDKSFAIFTAKNVTDMRDKVEVEQSSEVKIVIDESDSKL